VSKKILIIDDDTDLLELLKEYLGSFKFEVEVAATPALGLPLARRGDHDLLILDVMLPEQDGFSVLKELRQESDVPVIMLTARGDVTDRVVGLELGADDYLPKPFEPRELVARIQTILRRGGDAKGRSRYQFGELTIDLDSRTALIRGDDVALSTLEYEVLLLLAQNSKRTFNRDQIVDRLKGTDWATFNRSVDVLISRLRTKLGDDPKSPKYIKTVWGTGYTFVGKKA
jgi:DNA-binding response OmpR family regulator